MNEKLQALLQALKQHTMPKYLYHGTQRELIEQAGGIADVGLIPQSPHRTATLFDLARLKSDPTYYSEDTVRRLLEDVNRSDDLFDKRELYATGDPRLARAYAAGSRGFRAGHNVPVDPAVVRASVADLLDNPKHIEEIYAAIQGQHPREEFFRLMPVLSDRIPPDVLQTLVKDSGKKKWKPLSDVARKGFKYALPLLALLALASQGKEEA